MTIRMILEYDDVANAWAAYCPELPGLNSCGDTEEEALTNFKEASELYFEPSEVAVPDNAKVLQLVV